MNNDPTVFRFKDFDRKHSALLVDQGDYTPELRQDARDWLASNMPNAVLFADPATDFGLSIRFARKEDARLFVLFWQLD